MPDAASMQTVTAPSTIHAGCTRRIELEVTDAARSLLGREGYDPTFGARPLKRTIQRLVQDPLSLKLLQRELNDGDTVTVDAEGEKIVLRPKAAVAH